MITKGYFYVATVTAYFIGVGAGYILTSENATIYSAIISLLFGMGFAAYLLPIVMLKIKVED